MNIKPVADKILIQIDEAKSQEGSLYIPKEARQQPRTATVIEVGSGRITEKGVRVPFEVKKGDKVVINQYGLMEITIDGQKYHLITEDDIVAILT